MDEQAENKTNYDFYQSLRKKVDDYLNTEEGRKYKFAEFLLIAPDLFHLLIKLTMDKEVPVSDKACLAAAVAYYISPFDLIPDFLFPLGLIDDVAVAAFVLNRIINNTSPEVVGKYWAGNESILETIKKVLQKADELIGSGLWKKIKKMFEQ
ncbi:MAG: DUF1232 domain-containing protein [Clostridiales bacterium]|jgi:uncharacterized membrane protein YkvA (DUF1232 family)|nr:DUF1232 domain-containing protein [Clostridiales bacterium]